MASLTHRILILCIGFSILIFGSCHNTEPNDKDPLANTPILDYPDPVTFDLAEQNMFCKRRYYQYGNPNPFRADFGTVIRYPSADSIIFKYCRDSFRTVVHGGKIQFSDKQLCYNPKTIFVDGKLLVKSGIYPVGKYYQKDSLIRTVQVETSSGSIELNQIRSLRFKDIQGDTTLQYAEEYWSEIFGLILRFDKNIPMNKARTIITEKIRIGNDSLYTPRELIDYISKDSVIWNSPSFNM